MPLPNCQASFLIEPEYPFVIGIDAFAAQQSVDAPIPEPVMCLSQFHNATLQFGVLWLDLWCFMQYCAGMPPNMAGQVQNTPPLKPC